MLGSLRELLAQAVEGSLNLDGLVALVEDDVADWHPLREGTTALRNTRS